MPELEERVAEARNGDRAALEDVVSAIQKDVYGLALRFLWHPEDAEDATQEILVRVVTHLGSFEGRSRFRTWVYRVATNALLTMRQKRMEEKSLGFGAFGADLADGLSDDEPSSVDDVLFLEEVKIGCTHAMLLCLDREQRLAYILGDILELDHNEASEALGITPAAFRKRLSRARDELVSFMKRHCGLFEPANPCRCRRRVRRALATGRLDREHLLFATNLEKAKRFPEVLSAIRTLEETRRATALYRSHPDPTLRKDSSQKLLRTLDSLRIVNPNL